MGKDRSQGHRCSNAKGQATMSRLMATSSIMAAVSSHIAVNVPALGGRIYDTEALDVDATPHATIDLSLSRETVMLNAFIANPIELDMTITVLGSRDAGAGVVRNVCDNVAAQLDHRTVGGVLWHVESYPADIELSDQFYSGEVSLTGVSGA